MTNESILIKDFVELSTLEENKFVIILAFYIPKLGLRCSEPLPEIFWDEKC